MWSPWLQPSYGVEGKTREFCSSRATEGMIDIHKKRCAHPICNKKPLYGVEGSKKAEFCSPHAKYGMVNLITGRVCVRPNGSGGGALAVNRLGGRVGEGRKRKSRSLQAERLATKKRTRRASAPAIYCKGGGGCGGI